MSKFYPVLIDISLSKCLVIGGGKVALRKVNNLLEFDADITVLSPQLSDVFEGLNGKFKYIQKKYGPGDAADYDIVFSAIDDKETDLQIEKDCRAAKILLNSAGTPDISSFIVPATIKQGDLTVSVASQGKTPFYTRHIKEEIEKALPEDIGPINEIAVLFRDYLLSGKFNFTEAQKKKLYAEFLKQKWSATYNRENLFKIFDELIERLT